MKIKIDKGIPVPPAEEAPQFPLEEMEVGDSFILERAAITRFQLTLSIQLLRNLRPDIDFQFANQANNQIRVWRVR